MSSPLLSVRGLCVTYPLRGGFWGGVQGQVRAVRHVDFDLAPGEILAVVGESGCGKSTLASALVGLRPWQAGTLQLQGQDYPVQHEATWNMVRSQVQMVFQDPYGSLNPRQTLREILEIPQRVRGISASEAHRNALEALEQVGLSSSDIDRFPHAFSGGQRQRIGIARALAVRSRLLICDEPTSALDVSVQAQILQLLQDLRNRLGLSLVLISHDLSVVRALADRILVMYLGSIVEELPAHQLYQGARHPYTRALLDAVPTLDRQRPPRILGGDIPSLTHLPTGCVFASRCAWAEDRCRREEPLLEEHNGVGRVRCPIPNATFAQ